MTSSLRRELSSPRQVDGAYPLLARRGPGDVRIQQGDDHGERFRVEGGDLRAPELALLVGQGSQYAGEQAGLRKCRVFLDPSHGSVQRIADRSAGAKARDATQFFQEPGYRQEFDRAGCGSRSALLAHVGYTP